MANPAKFNKSSSCDITLDKWFIKNMFIKDFGRMKIYQ